MPTMATISEKGSTAIILRIKPGVVAKRPPEVPEESPQYDQMTRGIHNTFRVEHGIFQVLGDYPRIMK